MGADRRPTAGAWLSFVETVRDGVVYRSFRPDTSGKYGVRVLSYVGFPSDGSACIDSRVKGKIKTIGSTTVTTDGYSFISTTRDKVKINLKTHIAVAYLWGAPNVTGTVHAMSEQLVVDHINGKKTDYALANLRLTTQHHNAQLGNGIVGAAASSSSSGKRW